MSPQYDLQKSFSCTNCLQPSIKKKTAGVDEFAPSEKLFQCLFKQIGLSP